jgi:glycosyltransferase involved in cell wall biosynthesis
MPELRGEIYGDGPDRAEVLRLRSAHDLEHALEVPGFVSSERVDEALARALCLVLPSRREGYGLVVVEASACATPSIVVAAPDSAAVELVDEGMNGFVARSARPEDLADAIIRVAQEGFGLRASTARWFAQNAERLSIARSLDVVSEIYAGELT